MTPKQVNQPSSFILDPARDGIGNALWKEVTATIGLSGATPDQYRFNAAEGLVRTDLTRAIVEFSVNFPLTGAQTPTNLVNDIEFGLKNLSLALLGKISLIADKSENKFSLVTYDDFGTAETTEIPWVTDWNGAQTVFRVEWGEKHVTLKVREAGGTEFTDVVDANGDVVSHKVSVPGRALNPFVAVTGAENFDVDFIAVRNAQRSSIMLV